MDIQITSIKIFKIKPKGALLGYANIIINNCFVIRGIRILETETRGKFIAMPSRPLRSEKKLFRDLCRPLNKDTKDLITIAILDEYNSQEIIEK